MSIPDLAITWTDCNLWIAVSCVIFNPLYWNLVARWNYRTKRLENMFGSARFACCLFGMTIFLLGVFRDWRFYIALSSQPRWLLLQSNCILWVGYTMSCVGFIFVASSYWALGFYGTFLGDYFGILLPSKVTSFPFNILNNPMYIGATLNFLGTSLVCASQAGILLTILVGVCYIVATSYEEPFMNSIYAEASKDKRT